MFHNVFQCSTHLQEKFQIILHYFLLAYFRRVLQRIPMNTKEPMDGYLRTRCKGQLKRKLETVAELQGIDLSDVVRIACNQYVIQFMPNHLQQPLNRNGSR